LRHRGDFTGISLKLKREVRLEEENSREKAQKAHNRNFFLWSAAARRRFSLRWAFPKAGASSRTPKSTVVLLDRLGATAADGGISGVRADVGFPMPATLAFLAVGFCNRN
jgi:hypothetical protein